MLVVKLVLWPFGRSSDAKEIGRLEISNEGGPEEACRYLAAQYGEDVDGKSLVSRRFVRVTHDRGDGAWKLVEKSIDALVSTCENSKAARAAKAYRQCATIDVDGYTYHLRVHGIIVKAVEGKPMFSHDTPESWLQQEADIDALTMLCSNLNDAEEAQR